MKIKNNIFSKTLFFLMLFTVWGGTSYAQRVTPNFETAYNPSGSWYNITYWSSGNYYAAQGDGANLVYGNSHAATANGQWQLIGTIDHFVLRSKNGMYAKWESTRYVGTTVAANATEFSLVNMQGTARVDYWGIRRNNNTGSNNIWNPQGGQVKEWNNNDNNSSVKFIALAPDVTEIPFRVIITGDNRTDEVITYHNNSRFRTEQTSMLVDGAPSTVRNGEYLRFKGSVTRQNLLDCDFTSSAPSRGNGKSFVYGPVIDWENRTITCEVREAVTALPETGWYQLKWTVSSNNASANSRYTDAREDNFTNNTRDANRFYLTMPKNGNPGRREYVNYSKYPTTETTPLTFVKLVRSGNNLMMMTIDGRYVDQSGYPSTSGSGYANPVTYVDGELDFQFWLPFGTDASYFMGKASGTHNYFYTTRAKFDDDRYDFYEVFVHYEGSPNMLANIGTVTYNGPATNYSMPTVYPGGYFVFPKGTALQQSHLTINGAQPKTVTIDAANNRINIELPLPGILHRKSYLFDRLNGVSDSQLPGDAYIHRGEGMTTNPFTHEEIQYTSNYTITQYLKHDAGKQLFMPTIDGNNSEVTAYQRWYDYEHETLPRTDVINIPAQRGAAALYRNGIVVGSNNSRGDILKNATAILPTGLNDYWLAVDQSRYNDGANHANGDITEPSITMRVIYHLIDAKVMANKMNECTLGSDNWIEEHNISFPNKKLWNGSNDTKSGVDYVGLNHEFSNYWCFNGQGTGDANLEQMVDGKLIVELDQAHSTAMLRNVKILATNDAGIKGVQGFARNRFIAFQYPESRVVPENSHAVINVYMQNSAGTRFQLARIKLTFIGNAEPLLLNEVYGKNEDGSFKSLRSKEAMEATYGRAVSELTFDHNEYLTFICPTRQGGYSNENSQAYAFPLDFKQSSYAYHGAPWASRGEYIFRNAGTIGGKAFYPIDSYKDAIDNGASNPAAKEGKYFLYVDASEQPGQVMSIPIPERLCVGSRMFCYGWFNSATQISQESVGIVINIIGKLNEDDEEGEIIYSYNPGLLSTWAFNSNNQPVEKVCNAAPWRQVGFSFNIDSKMAGRYAAYEMQVMNNCYSTNGGDYTLDNFYIYVNPPKGNVDFTTPLCSDALRHVKVHTDYDMLVETSGVNVEAQDATLPVSFCFLNKEIFDEQTKDYYDVDAEGKRTLKENVDYDDPAIKLIFNTAFGDALIGVRSINKEVKGHGFHNFTVPVNYESIPTYAFNDSPDDYIFKEEKDNGERRIVFKEQLYQSTGDTHQWEPGKSYYLLFAPYHVGEDDVNHHEVGTHVFHISDMCCVLTTFSIMPPIEVKGDATITSSDKVKACDNQIVTFKVDMPAMKLNDDATGVTDAVISGLNYDWWIGTSKANATHAGFLAANLGTYASVEDARRYNHKSVNDYPNDDDVDRNVYLESALSNIRFYFPEAATLDEVTLVDYDNDTGYGVVNEHIDCVKYFLSAENHGGRKPLSLFGQTFNLKVSHAEADANNKQHFVAIPIIPEQQYGVDEKLIYCPSPQELIIEVGPTAPNMQNGFAAMTYPDHIVNVPIRIGKQQIDGVRKAAEASLVGNTLNIPLRKIIVTGSNSTELIAKDHETERFGSIFLTATDDKHYSFDTEGGEFRMRRVAQVIDIHAPKGATDDAYMKVTFTNDFTIHEGCTYTLKLPYVEDEECECEGTLVFDLKVVPEYVTWTADTGNSDWTNDRNWARADRSELNADNAAMGNVITNATSLSEATYPDNAANKTANAFVPMYFTNVLVGANETVPQLYSGIVPATQTAFLSGLKNTATSDIKYDMEVTPVDASHRTGYVYNCNYTCEPFGTYIANGLTFLPGGRMLNAERLDYHKAWVEYELDVNRWYTLSSPLQDTFAGEWYAPTGNDVYDAAKQVTPHFYDINYSESDCDRFRPAIYQRSWDSEANVNNVWMKDGTQCNAYITDDWSYVYNDVLEKYATGGFSVKVSDGHMSNKPADEKALVRLPKADVKYTYYDIDSNTGSKADDFLPAMTNRSRLWTDKFTTAESFEQTISNAVSSNNYFLVGNPFMTNLDMDEFFRQNPQFEKTYWVLSENGQTVSVRSAYANANDTSVPADERWTLTEADGDFAANVAVVAPLQAFFVKTTAVTNTTKVKYTPAMQTVAVPVLKPLRSFMRPSIEDVNEEDDAIVEDIQHDVYSVDGKRVGVSASRKSFATSRKGVYIIDGRKMIIK